VDDGLGWICKEVMAYFRVLYQHLPGRDEEGHVKSQSR
jgi:hypothetical protein